MKSKSKQIQINAGQLRWNLTYHMMMGVLIGILTLGCKENAATATLPAPKIPDGAWYRPKPYLWILQEETANKRKQPSTPWRITIADGNSTELDLDWQAIGLNEEWRHLKLELSLGADKPFFYEQILSKRTDKIELPMLPRGGYWLTIKTYNQDHGLEGFWRYYLNIQESPVPVGQFPETETTGLRVMTEGGNRIRVSGQGKAESIRLSLSSMEGDLLDRRDIQLPSDEKDPLTLEISELIPGKTFRLQVEAFINEQAHDRADLWIANPGDYPPAPDWGDDDRAGSIFDYVVGETINSMPQFSSQVEGMEKQVASMKNRGSEAIQLWVIWNQIEPLEGARNWENLDRYVNFLTEKKIPFTLAGAGSVLFGNAPECIWSDWALNDKGDYKLWRTNPIMSPASQRYVTKAQNFIRAMVERYKSNPYLVGYIFLSQGMDSGIFQDQHETIMDYSAVARESFQKYLQEHYGEISSLNKAWGTSWKSWNDVPSPLPELHNEVNLSQPWQDWTQWKLKVYRDVSVDLFEPIVAELDPERPSIQYTAKTGPFEYLFHNLPVKQWGTADGAGEDYRMGRINNITKSWGLWRQTESHEVPPANKRHMMDLWAQSLRNGGSLIRYNLVFNSLASLFLEAYPNNENLQNSMKWWTDTASLREHLSHAQVKPPALGVYLSWADLLFRKRTWRWYTMPGDRADAFIRAQDYLPVTWLSEWTPETEWTGLSVVLVPEDALIWDQNFRERLAAFTKQGGSIVIWGRAGQYSTDSEKQSFKWLEELGAPEITAESLHNEEGKNYATLRYNGKQFTLEPVVSVTDLPDHVEALADSKNRAILLSWRFGKGTVQWCLADTPGESERLIGELLKEREGLQEVRSSNSRVDAFCLHLDGIVYVIVNRFLGFGVKEDESPITTKITLPGLKGEGEMIFRRLLPEGEQSEVSAAQLKQVGWTTQLFPSEMEIYEIRSTDNVH